MRPPSFRRQRNTDVNNSRRRTKIWRPLAFVVLCIVGIATSLRFVYGSRDSELEDDLGRKWIPIEDDEAAANGTALDMDDGQEDEVGDLKEKEQRAILDEEGRRRNETGELVEEDPEDVREQMGRASNDTLGQWRDEEDGQGTTSGTNQTASYEDDRPGVQLDGQGVAEVEGQNILGNGVGLGQAEGQGVRGLDGQGSNVSTVVLSQSRSDGTDGTPLANGITAGALDTGQSHNEKRIVVVSVSGATTVGTADDRQGAAQSWTKEEGTEKEKEKEKEKVWQRPKQVQPAAEQPRPQQKSQKAASVPPPPMVELPQPDRWIKAHPQHHWFVRLHNPSIVRLPHKKTLLVYGRLTTWAQCGNFRRRGNDYDNLWSRVAMCKAATYPDAGNCNFAIQGRLLPPSGGCGNNVSPGAQDIRLFWHEGVVWGLGAYKELNAGHCRFRPLLVRMDQSKSFLPDFSSKVYYKPRSALEDSKNWAVLPFRPRGLASQSVLVVNRPNPFEIGTLDLSLSRPSYVTIHILPRWHRFSNLPGQIRGSTNYLPLPGKWAFPSFPESYLGLVHFRLGESYRHLFLLLAVVDPNASLDDIRSHGSTVVKRAARSSPFYFGQDGKLVFGKYAKAWDDIIQFSSGMECESDACDHLLIAYSRGDCSGHISRVSMQSVKDRIRIWS